MSQTSVVDIDKPKEDRQQNVFEKRKYTLPFTLEEYRASFEVSLMPSAEKQEDELDTARTMITPTDGGPSTEETSRPQTVYSLLSEPASVSLNRYKRKNKIDSDFYR